MASSPPPSRLTPLQRDLLAAFFAREQRFFLTGGGALAGFYLGHRTTEDLDLFSPPGPDLDDAARALEAATEACGGTGRAAKRFGDFQRIVVTRGDEECIVDLVIDRAPPVDPVKATRGAVRVDTLREIAANKVCTLVSRSEIKDLVDLAALVEAGVDLELAVADAKRKDGGAEPVALAWVLDQIAIGPDAALPGGADPARILAFRDDLVKRLRAIAFRQARGA
jgi:hypothetical protein